MTDNRFSRREWWLLISLLLMVEYWIFSLSHSISGDQAIINYVSFASSIASILLAVIAIIYGFIQNDAQQSSARTISEQVSELRNASGDLAGSKDQLESQLDRVAEFASSIGAVSANLRTFQGLMETKLDSLGQGFASLHEKLASEQKPAAQVPLFEDKSKLAHAVLGQTTFEADLLTVALYESDIRGEHKEPIPFVLDHFAKPLTTAGSISTIGQGLGTGHQIVATLRALGLLKEVDGGMVFSTELRSYLVSAQNRISKYDAEIMKKGVPAIRGSFGKSEQPTQS